MVETARAFSSQPNRFTRDAITSWNLTLPVETGTFSRLFDCNPRYPSLEEGIPAVLSDSIGFWWRHSLLDRSR
jgi:hypothetical protein